MALICVKDAALGYEGKQVASDINFEVNEGDYLCIVGENGSGKSTLIKTILGLLPALGGSVDFGDGLKQNEIGYLPQQTDVQKDFPASVQEIVLSGCLNRTGLRPFYNQEEKEIAQANCEKMGIANLTKACYRELSGGQQQRVLLARALSATRKILLLDEPVAGLDPKATESMYELIAELNNNQNITIVMVSHDVETSLKYANRILDIGAEESFFGTTDEFIKHRYYDMPSFLLGGDAQ